MFTECGGLSRDKFRIYPNLFTAATVEPGYKDTSI
jgi:hypothetical protein